MGVMKKYIGAWAIEIANLKYDDGTINTASTISHKDTNGNIKNTVIWVYSTSYQTTTQVSANSFRPSGLIPVATNDVLDNYDINDYQINPIGTTSHNSLRTLNENNAHLTYNVAITNSDSNTITISCIKFKKRLYNGGTGTSLTYYDLLMYAYFLDEPITIAPGETESLNVDFEIKVE